MKRLLPLVFLFLNGTASLAQTVYGNEWIDHDRRYWKFEIVADGVYRIDSAALASSGFPVGSVDPRQFMLFGKEAQVPIYVKGEADGVFNATDFIEFRAEHADGIVDKRMYPYPDAAPNTYVSLYNDTVRYYLTWDPVAPNGHMLVYDNTDFASHTARPWAYTTALRTFMDYYWVGYIDRGLGAQGIAATSGMMVESEGFGGAPLFNNGSVQVDIQDVVVNTPGAYTAADAPDAKVTAVAAALNNDGQSSFFDHHLRILYGPGYSLVGLDTIFNGSRVIRRPFSIPGTMVGASVPIRYNVPHDLLSPGQVGFGLPNYLDWEAVSSVAVRYARTFAIGGSGPLQMDLPPGGADPLALFDITSFTGTPIVYAKGDVTRRMNPTLNGGTWQVLFPTAPSGAATETYLFAEQDIRPINALRPVNGTGYFTDFGALDLDSAMLIVAHASLMSGAMQYKQYRESPTTENRYSALVADVDELYDQFGGGVPKHAGAIRMFSKFLLDTWTTVPRSLFLIGKSVNSWPAFGVNGLASIRPNVNGAYARTLVPTYGYPSCDQCFTTGLNFDGRRMDIPVGRLSANNNAEVLAYLEKVRATEAQVPALWQKNILHFAGGFGSGQQEQLSLFLNAFGAVAQDTCFGGNVVLFRKNSSDVIQLASADSVRRYIEDEGVTLMTFFAHAFSSSFDITIDDPANYDWHGKHPMIIGNSCYIGNIHQNGDLSNSEVWVKLPNAGPIAFMSSTDLGITGYLAGYTVEFYRSFSKMNYNKSIGEHMKYATLQSQISSPTLATAWNAHTFTLEGDPTLILNSHPLPDYAVNSTEIIIDPPTVTADVDTFTVKVVVSNLGKAVNRTFNVELQRSNPGLGPNPINYFASLSNVIIRDTAVFQIPTRGFSGGQGVNQLSVRVDLEPDQVLELDDAINNVTSTTLFITSGDLVPAYPYDFAIVPDPVTILKASTGDPLAPIRNYVFQIDTTDLFNSPVKETATIMAPGGVVTWQPSSIYALNNFQDSTVFYWRCSIDSTGNDGYNWYERSFQFISGKRGWGQAHYFQFKNDTYGGIVYDRPDREFEFYNGVLGLRANVLGNVGGPFTEWYVELEAQDYGGCGPAAWHVAVVDPTTFEAWQTYWVDGSGVQYNPDHQFGNGNNNGTCRNRPEKYFSFHTNVPSEMAGLQNMITNEVPDGHHLLFYSWLYMDKDGMAANGPGLMPALQTLGAPDFNTLQDSVPYIFYVQKGNPASFQDTIGTVISQQISLSVSAPVANAQGIITTMDAGPATAWHGLFWNESPSDALDSTRIKLQGLPASGGPPVDLMDLASPLDSFPSLGALIDAAVYPRLRIRGQFFDANPIDTKPAQLERWQLLSSPVPECAIHPPLGYFNGLNGWAEGQNASVAVAVQNISEFDMDSLLMAAWVVNSMNVRSLVHYRVKAPLAAGAWLVDTVQFSTIGFGGANTLVIEANPIDTATGRYHQLEQYHFNNIAQWRFDVEQDLENPVLDVTFDGMHILDGDIVSARPEIMVSLDDENTIRILDSPADTASFKVFLLRPGQATTERIFFRDIQGTEILQFVPATAPANIARIHYRPNFPTDGKYRFIVQASDLSHNVSGDNDYKVNFEVINRSTITDVLNYPNPFTTSTRFVFTVTGVEPPSYMKIQILTVTGKVVREVKSHELGPIRVGRNITEYAWDGTDEFGDRLARGVYLYRVIARLNGEDIETRETKASEYFTKGFGKMYLMR